MRYFYINERTKGFNALYKAAKGKKRGEKLVVFFDGSELDYSILPTGGCVARPPKNWVIIGKVGNCTDKWWILLNINGGICDKKTEIEQKNNVTLAPIDTPKCVLDHIGY